LSILAKLEMTGKLILVTALVLHVLLQITNGQSQVSWRGRAMNVDPLVALRYE